ncbi:hypothetical protein ACO0E1_02640 [Curtobacterium sp. RRHDQ66]|uniref:hypothetical protein n=1 Tax=Curtobacterium guangdongense TaxID=3413380 RepID=UPI003BF3E20F
MRYTAALVVGPLSLLLAGCAMSDEGQASPEARIAAAKESAQGAEKVVVELIPTSSRIAVSQRPNGVLVSCGDGKQWSGSTRVSLASGVAVQSVFDAVTSDALESKFTVDEQTSSGGNPRLQLGDDAGNTVYLSPRAGGTGIDIDSFSKCFSVPADFQDEGTY